MTSDFYSARRLLEMEEDLLRKNRHKITHLTQQDFIHGTYRITKPGIYKLSENIIFDPEKDNDYQPQLAQYHTPPYILGFFAAITVECEEVIIDLNQYTLEQSLAHSIQQRFYSNIELSSGPFMPGQGPGNFGSHIKSAYKCIIMNGTLGRSSHHGIHGNATEMVLIHNLKIHTFEVAGIAINGCNSLRINKCKIGPVNQKVPVLGTYSAARFALQFAKRIPLLKLTQDEQTHLQELIDYLQIRSDRMFQSIITNYESGDFEKDPIFYNKFLIPDGNTYGLLLHPTGVAINELVTSDLNPNKPCDVIVDNVSIIEIKARVDETIGMSLKDGTNVQLDVSGSVYQIDNEYFITTDKKHIPNDLTSLQLFLAELSIKYELKLGKNNINQDLIDWSKNNKTIKEVFFKKDSLYKYKLNCDDMFHINKGVFGIRADAIKDLRIENCLIRNIENTGRLGNTELGGEYQISHDAQKIPGYHGADTTGINLSYCEDVKINRISIKNIISSNGECRGIRMINSCSNIIFKCLNIQDLHAGILFKGKYLAEDYHGVSVDYSYKYPNLLPNSVGIKEVDQCSDLQVHTDEISISDLTAPGCAVNIWLQ